MDSLQKYLLNEGEFAELNFSKNGEFQEEYDNDTTLYVLFGIGNYVTSRINMAINFNCIEQGIEGFVMTHFKNYESLKNWLNKYGKLDYDTILRNFEESNILQGGI